MTDPAPMAVARWRLAEQTSARLPLPPRIAASWQRSAERGVSYVELHVPRQEDFDQDSALLCGARPVLGTLESSLQDEPLSILLSDAEGLVLSRHSGQRPILAALDQVALAPGSTYSEAAVGTNGFGVALADN